MLHRHTSPAIPHPQLYAVEKASDTPTMGATTLQLGSYPSAEAVDLPAFFIQVAYFLHASSMLVQAAC